MTDRIAIAGGGVFGATAALELARRGRRVVLVDPGSLPRPEAASTDLCKAVRLDYGDDELLADLAEKALHGWRRWNEEAVRPFFHETGLLVLTDAMRPGSFEEQSRRVQASRGVPVRDVDPDWIARSHPPLAGPRYGAGYLNPLGGWVESGSAMAWILERAAEAGVELREGVGVEGLLEGEDRVEGLRTTAGPLRADETVVAAGAWTPSLLPDLSELLMPVGQPLFFLRPEDPEPFAALPVWTADVARTGWYGFPLLRDGTVKVGNHGPGRPIDPDAERVVAGAEIEALEAFLADAFPALAALTLAATRLCLYCDSRDGDFLIDRHPEMAGLTLATGGSGHAFKFAPLLGPVVADAVEGRAPTTGARFRWREPQEGGGEGARAQGAPESR